jgi:hypothetical protein
MPFMTRIRVESTPAAPTYDVVHVHEVADEPGANGTNLVLVVIALTVLVALVALIFYVLPSIMGTPAVNVNIRNP